MVRIKYLFLKYSLGFSQCNKLWIISFRIEWRLAFVNLKKDLALNAFDHTIRERLWVPNLVFENNPNGWFVRNEPLSVLRVQQKGHPGMKFDFKIHEYQEYTGAENPIVFENIYEMKLSCEMELHYYPFDTQHCFILVSKIF